MTFLQQANTQECLNKPGTFQCICKPGFTGIFCHEDVDECAENGGLGQCIKVGQIESWQM